MKNVLKIRIPTFLGLLILFVGVGASTLLVQNISILQSDAAGNDSPKDVRITNVTDTSLTVSYQTNSRVPGSLSYGTAESLGTVVFDDRDLATNSPTNHSVHYFTLTNLQPSTEYFFSILSGNSTYLQNNAPFKIKTGPQITTSPPNMPQLSGLVALPEGAVASDVVLYLQSGKSQAVSTLLRPNTSYVISLSYIRTADFSSYAPLSPESLLQLSFVSIYGNSKVTVAAGQKNQLPLIVLSNNYDFSSNPLPSEPPVEASDSPSFPLTDDGKQVKGTKTTALPKRPFTNSTITPTLKPTLPPAEHTSPL